jgi:autotransporter-associated beta strand protein
MGFFSLRKWLNRKSRSARRSSAPKPGGLSRKLSLELLEERLAPATYIWSGGGGATNIKWSSGANWVGGVAPTGSASTLDDLVFDSRAAQRMTQNDLASATFNSITLSASNYTLKGNALTLGSTTASGTTGFITVGVGALSEAISLNLQLGGPAGTDQFFTVNTGGVLTVSGQISGTTGSSLTKEGTGTLFLVSDNSGFTGKVKLDNNSGIVNIQNANALGTGPNTTVGTNSQLQVQGVANPITEPLLLNGPGINNTGALLNVAGNNTWAGPIELDSAVTIGATAGSLNISGQISDLGAGQNLTKEGLGQIIFSHAGGNTYRGLTTINNGILTIEDPLSLGPDASHGGGTAASGTLVNQVGGETGTLQLLDPNYATDGGGFTVLDEQLTLNGTGVSGSGVTTFFGGTNIGALNNSQGNNQWAGPITLGSPAPNGSNVSIGVSAAPVVAPVNIAASPGGASESGSTVTITTKTAHGFTAGQMVQVTGVAVAGYNGLVTITSVPTPTTFTYTATQTGLAKSGGGTVTVLAPSSLIISGVIGDVALPSGPFNLIKVDTGELILNNSNTYQGNTDVELGVLDIRDSQALGSSGKVGTTTVEPGASLALEVDSGLDPHGRDLAKDSVTGLNGNGPQLGLTIANKLTINGTGINATVFTPTGPILARSGALHSLSGINRWTSPIALGTLATDASIGVEPDPHASSDFTYFTHDYSLTVTGDISGGSSTNFEKFDNGQLILPNANDYTGLTFINQGWVTIQNDQSLGARIPGLGDTIQPPAFVANGAALHLKPLLVGGAIHLAKNLILSGNGISHPFGLISQKGALMNLAGVNTVGSETIVDPVLGPVNITSWIQLEQNVGIGVENPDPAFPQSDLTVSASVADLQPFIIKGNVGGANEDSNVFPAMFPSGSMAINWTFTATNDLQVYYPPRGLPGSTLLFDTGAVKTSGSATVAYPGAATIPANLLEIVVNPGGKGSGGWSYTAVVTPDNPGGGGINKFGSQRLTLQADSTYTGPVDVQEGVLLIQNDTALGRASSGTTAGTEAFTGTTTTVDTGAVLQLTGGLANLNGGIAAGIQPYNEHLVLNGLGQQVAVAGSHGTFTLTFNGQTTTALDITSPTLAADMQAALNALSSIGGLASPASVTVSQGSGATSNIFTVVFGGSLAQANNPLFTATKSANVAVVITGANVQLVNLSGDNMWRGPVSLGVSSGIDVTANSRLSIMGTVDDAQQTLVVPTGTGQFTLTFNGATTGVLNLGDPALASKIAAALNGLSTIGKLKPAGSVTVTQSTANPNFFTITFGGSLAGPQPPITATGIGIANPVVTAGSADLIKLDSGELVLGGANSYRGVTHIGTSTAFGDTNNQPGGILTIENPLALGSAAGGTQVANGSTLQLQGNITVAGEPLMIQGTGAGAIPTNVPLRWFNVGSAPINNGPTPNNEATTGRVTSVAIDPTDPNVIYLATAGGGAWRTRNGGLTWLQMFDSASIQTINVHGTAGTFTLTFNGSTTSVLDLSSPTLAADIQKALNALPSIGGLTPVPGSVTVIQSTLDPVLFNVTFGGALSGINLPLLTGKGITASDPVITGPTGVTMGGPSAALYTGAIAVDPHDPRIIYLGTGEADNSADSFYGTGVYVSKDSGQTWTLMTASDGSNPLYGLAISKIIIDPGYPGTTAPTGRIYVGTSDVVANAPPPTPATPEIPGVYRFDTASTQAQTLTLPSLSAAGTFTLTFTNPTTLTTATTKPISYTGSVTSMAAAIKSALGALSNVGGTGNLDVLPSPVDPLVFNIVFVNALASQPQQPGFPIPKTNYSTIVNLPLNPPLMTVSGSALLSTPVISPASLWVNLTDATSSARHTQVGQGKFVVNTPGPDDDFRIAFPQGSMPPASAYPPPVPAPPTTLPPPAPSHGTWSDLSLVYFDTTFPYTGTAPTPGIPNTPGQGPIIGSGIPGVPVLYASLATSAGDGNNAVFRTEQPELAQESRNATVWFVGDPGVSQDEIQSITINPWQSSGSPTGTYTLTFEGDTTSPAGGFFSTTDSTFTGVSVGGIASTLQSALNSLPSIADVGGHVVVTLHSEDPNNLVFYVEWTGLMGNTQQPLLTTTYGGGSIKVTISEVQKGSGIDNRSSGEFPTGAAGNPTNGNIKFGMVVSPNPDGFAPVFDQVTLYAAVTNPGPGIKTAGQLMEILTSVNGGKTWKAVATAPPNYMGANTATSAAMGWYDSTLLVVNPTTVYVGGQETNTTTHLGGYLRTTDGGKTWTDISADAAGNGPHGGAHAMTIDALGRILVGTDGGLWEYDTTKTAPVWNDINGNLAITSFNSVSANPNNFNNALGGSQGNGVELFSNNTAWFRTDVSDGDGGQVQFDPKNPNIAYAVHVLNGNVGFPGDGFLDKSTDGGNTWSVASPAGPNSLPLDANGYFPFLVDTVNSARLLAGSGGGLQESLDGGVTWQNILNVPTAVKQLAAATYQGNFVLDPGFPLVTDQAANTYDPNTIYLTNGAKIFVTKDHGQSWQDRTPPGSLTGGTLSISGLAVDPGNRDTVYLVSKKFGLSKVLLSTDAGQTWTDITFNLPNIPTWAVAVDPRTDSPTKLGQGTVYIGNDNGVWQLPAGSTTWVRFGAGMPSVQVRSLQLNQALNTLTAGTYGRSMFQFFLSDTPSSPSASIAPTPGGATETGTTVTITTSAPHSFIPGQQVVITGVSVPGYNGTFIITSVPSLTTFTYTAPLANMVASGGGKVSAFPVYGALRATSGSSIWTGPVQLVGGGNTPISNQVVIAASGSQTVQNGISAAQLNIIGTVSDLVPGSNPQLNKFGQGEVILSGTNTYGGQTEIKEGVLTVHNPQALGGTDIAEVQALTFTVPGTTFNLNFKNAPTPATFTYHGDSTDLANLTAALSSLPTIPQGSLSVTQSGNTFTITFGGVLSGFDQPLLSVAPTSGTGKFNLQLITDGAGGTIVDPGTALQLQSDLAQEKVQLNGDGTVFNGHNQGALRNVSGKNTFTGTLILNNPTAFITPTGATESGSTVTITTLSPHGFIPGQTVQIAGVGVAGYNGPATITSVPSPTTFTYTANQTGLAPSGGGTAIDPNLTIGVDSGTSLVIGARASLPGGTVGTITDGGLGRNLVKELTGTLILASADTYGGTTTVNQGALQVQNALALSGSSTEVKDGGQLQLQSAPVQSITVTGTAGTFTLTFNGQTTASLAFNATPDQVQTALNGLTSIGGMGGSVAVSLAGNVYTVAFQGSLGGTNQPPLIAVGSGGATAVVNPSAGTPVVVVGEPLTLSGTGIAGTGALLNTGGNNTWQGTIALGDNPAQLLPVGAGAATTPPPQVAIGVANVGDNLTINGVISQEPTLTSPGNNPLGLWKVGLGRLTLSALTQADNYPGVTTVKAGALRLQSNGTPLGINPAGAVVANGGVLELDGDPTGVGNSITVTTPVTLNGYGPAALQFLMITGTSGTFTLTFNGSTTGALDITSSTLATDIQQALNNLPSIQGAGGSVTVTPSNNGYLVAFGGKLANTAVGTLTATPQAGVAVNISVILPGQQGALRNVSGNNTYQGAITLQTTFVNNNAVGTSIGVDPGEVLTVQGTIQDPTVIPVPAGTLTKLGAGTLVLPNANTYSGATFVNNGILNIQNASSLGAGGPEQQTVAVFGGNGTFTLSFNGFTTTPLDVTSISLASDIQTALNNLPSIGGLPQPGSVQVTQGTGNSSNVFTVVFLGSLQFTNVPQLTWSNLSGGANLTITTIQDGPGGTVVNGGTLQVQGGITVSTENLTLSGTGFNNLGALENLAGSSDTWNSPITLGANATVSVDGPSDTLTFSQAIGDGGAGFGLTKAGPGTLIFTGNATTSNTYTGLTTVQDGTLQLAKTGGIALVGNVSVGDSPEVDSPADTDTVQLGQSNQLAATSTVTVLGDGLLDMNGQTQTIAGLNMTGGAVDLNGGQLSLTGAVTATSDSLGHPSVIRDTLGGGKLQLPASNPTIVVTHSGTAPVDMSISGLLASTIGFTKAGGGILQLTNHQVYTGTTSVNAGILQVDGSLGAQGGPFSPVSLTGGTLDGNGIVGTVTSATPVAPSQVSTMTTGDSGPGILTVNGNVAWNTKTNFFVELDGDQPGQGPGFSDQLMVNGTVNLGGATLTGVVDPGYIAPVNQSWVILKSTGLITGQFAQGGDGAIAFLGAAKFQVSINNNAAVKTITLTRLQTSTSTSVSALPTSGVPNTLYTVTATITPEPGANGPTPGTVTINVTGPGYNQTFNPTVSGTTAVVQLQGLAVGTYTVVSAVFHSADPGISGSSATAAPTFAVAQDTTTTSVPSASVTSPAVYGQQIAFQVTVTPGTQGGPAGNLLPTQTVTFQNGNTALPGGTVSVNPSGTVVTATYTTSSLGVGTYQINAAYIGDSNYQGSSSPSSLAYTVNKAGTTVTVGSTNTNAVYGEAVISATVAPQISGTPTGTVTFSMNNGAITETDSLSGGKATLQQVLGVGSYTITATYSGDSNFLSNANSNTVSQKVSAAATTTTVSSSTPNNTSVYGQSVTFTATINDSPSLVKAAGTVTFFIDGVQQVPNVTVAGGQATLTTSALTVSGSPHSVTATYNPAAGGNFIGSSGVLSGGQTVNQDASNVNVTADITPSAFGQAVTFTAVVSAAQPGSGSPGGQVQFFDGKSALGSVQTLQTVNGQQQVTLTVSNLPVGNHAITAQYQGDSNFTSNTSAIYNQFVKATTSTALVTSASPVFYGTSITFTATVTITSAPLGTPGGSVVFLDGSTQIGSQPLALVTGQYQAALTTNTLGAATHTITAQYQGDSNYAGSTSNSVSQEVDKANTSVSVSSTNTNSVYGEAAITATVIPSPTGGTPTGMVTFTVLNTATHVTTTEQDPLVNAVATLSLLSPGSYQISASYPGDSNYNGNSSNTINQTVSQAVTTGQLTSSANPSAFGQQVTFTDTIAITAPGSGSPTGTVTFLSGSTPLGNPVSVQKVNGAFQATLAVSNLPVGTSPSITAQYSGDTNFKGNTSNGVFQQVNAAQTATVVTSSGTPSGFGLPVTFTATVSVSSPGAGTPQGTVTFFDNNTAIAQVALQTVNGQQQASYTTQPTDLAIGTHPITATYNDSVDSNFASSTSSIFNQVIVPVATFTTVKADHVTPVVNHPVTFTVTVSTQTPTLSTPTGTVIITVDTVQTTLTLSNGQASLTLPSGLSLGNHFVSGTYQGNTDFVGSSSPTLTVTVLTPNQGYVAQVYRDLLNREADQGSLAAWSSYLDRGILNRVQVAASIESSTEYRSDVVDAFYVHYLHRHADPAGLNTFVNAMAFGMTDEQVAASLAGSPEYYNVRGGGTVNGFLDALFHDALNRAVDPSGRQSFTQALAFNVSRQQVAASVLGSPEYQSDLVTNYYNTYLHRSPDPNGLAAWVNALAHGTTDETVIASIIGSDEYFNNL